MGHIHLQHVFTAQQFRKQHHGDGNPRHGAHWRSVHGPNGCVQPSRHFATRAFSSSSAQRYGGYKGSAANHHHVYDNVLDVLLRNKSIATPIEEGLLVVQAIESMHEKGRRQK